MAQRKFIGSCVRTSITDAPLYKYKIGSTYLIKRILSDVVRKWPIFDLVTQMLGWTHDMVTLNKNIVCKHHVDRSKGESAIAFLGDFTGGARLVQEGAELPRIDEPYKWHSFCGKDLHWNEEITSGTK